MYPAIHLAIWSVVVVFAAFLLYIDVTDKRLWRGTFFSAAALLLALGMAWWSFVLI